MPYDFFIKSCPKLLSFQSFLQLHRPNSLYPSNAACMAGSLKTSFIPVKNLLYIKVKVTFAVEKTITETSDCKTIPSDCITESSDYKTVTSD